MASEHRFVISVRIIGAVQRRTPKLKMFMMSVLWSDQTEMIVYRSFQDFKKFHRLLKKKFPQLNPFQKNSRMIPKFRGEARRSSRPQNGPGRLVKRMKFLESYSDKLLKCDTNVTQSSEVTHFFIPKGHDLQSDFTKNCIVILLSDDVPDGSGGGRVDVGRQDGGNVSHPFVTQTYRCVDAFETKDTKNRPFKVAVDEKLDVLIKDPAGWWLVENESRCLAWFPAPYLELWDGEEDSDYQIGGSLYCAVRSYSTKKNDEVSVPIGSVVEVLRKSDDGWWLIRFNSKAGYIPSMYLQQYNEPLYNLRKRRSSTLNLMTSWESQGSPLPRNTAGDKSQGDSTVSSTGVPGRLHKAQSLDILTETQSQAVAGGNRQRERRISQVSQFSSSSDLYSNSNDEQQIGGSSPDLSLSDRRSVSPESNASMTSKQSETSPPRVPPRPKTEEILTRCTTMTRKAALATKTRLHAQPAESIYSR